MKRAPEYRSKLNFDRRGIACFIFLMSDGETFTDLVGAAGRISLIQFSLSKLVSL